MRYISIGKKQTIKAITNPETGKPLEYGIHELNSEKVWGHPFWRQQSANLLARERCIAAFEAAPNEGDCAELEGDDYEKYEPLATMKGVELPQHLAIPFGRIMLDVQTAPTKSPKELEAAKG